MAAKSSKTNKTDAVMRLLTGKKTAANPILDSEFKEKKITSRKKSAREGGTEIDIAGELVTEFLPKVLERFRCCRCPVCYADAMSEALEKSPVMVIRVNGKEDLKRAEDLKFKSRREILRVLIRIAIKRRRMEKHM